MPIILQAIPAGRLPWTPLPKISVKIAPSLDFSDESKNSGSPPSPYGGSRELLVSLLVNGSQITLDRSKQTKAIT